MSTTTQSFKNIFEQALLADAAYTKGLDGLVAVDALRDRLIKG